jgi:diazepam-binding inhibitor (GABA receptor modulating acyl-CoA-binding protein)
MSLDLQFKHAVDSVQNAPLANPPSDDIRLEFYAHYKQAIDGDVQEAAPSLFWFKARAKWNAWNSLKGMNKDKAKQTYIQLVNQYMS